MAIIKIKRRNVAPFFMEQGTGGRRITHTQKYKKEEIAPREFADSSHGPELESITAGFEIVGEEGVLD